MFFSKEAKDVIADYLLDHRHLDRGHQCQPDGRQFAAEPTDAAARILEEDGTGSDLELSRHLSRLQ
jgi:hypothetical protein